MPIDLWVLVWYHLAKPGDFEAESSGYFPEPAYSKFFIEVVKLAMKIVDVRETWIHVHFLVDSWEILPEEQQA